ncbi:MAG: rRNA maturation RNase YbeY [Candidatus Microgenomates bacterium]|jgi:probable rRNA maturation factor
MITVLFTKQSNYPVSSPRIKSILKSFLAENGIVSDAEVSLALVGEAKMLDIGKKYLKDKKLHNVLSFTVEEKGKNFIYPPDKLYLGEIIVCYPKVVDEAKMENKRIENKVIELVEHGALHLLGVHHE